MDSPFLIYVQYIMVIGGVAPVSLIESRKRLYIFYRYITRALMLFFIFALFGGNMNFSGSKDLLFKYINDRFIFIVVYVKLALTMSVNFEKLIHEMITYEANLIDKNEELSEIHQRIVKKTKIVQTFFLSNILVCWIAFIIPALVDYIMVQAAQGSTNSTTKTYSIKPYETWVPFDENEHYFSLLCFQGYYAFMGGGIYCAVQIILINLLLSVTLRLQILTANIKNLKNIETFDVNELIKIYAKEHADIIRNCQFLNSTVKYAMLMEFLITSGQLSMFIFIGISTDSPDTRNFSVTYIVNLVVQILTLYWHADKIREESVAVADAIYEVPWFEYDKGLVTSLHIIMMRSQMPLTLTLGPFGTMTLDVAVKIMKGSYTYVTFMQQIYGKLD